MLVRVCAATSALLAIGCAHAHLERFEHGEKVCEIESWVLGTGETEQVTSACGDYAYGTRDTGISDNGKAALGEISEGAVGALVPLPSFPIVWSH
jgi:hypothetical protein